MNPIIQKFITMMVPVAQKVQATWRVPTSVCIAQAALETGWGRSIVGNNYFGIKASTAGIPAVSAPTMEFENGKWISVIASFSRYDSLSQCADAYGKFLNDNERYAPCFQFCDEPLLFTEALQKAGYATDPSYAEKLNAIITTYNLLNYETIKS